MSRITIDTAPGNRPPPEDDTALFGRPKGLLTLSGLEVRERFCGTPPRSAFEVGLAPVVAAPWVRMGRGRPHTSNKKLMAAAPWLRRTMHPVH